MNFLWLLCLGNIVGNVFMIPMRVCEVHYKPGDVIIGGLFPVYDAESSSCAGDYWVSIVSMIESVTYAVELINNRVDILPNVTIGYEIRPNCGMEDLTLWSMITMTSTSGDVEYNNTCPNSYSRGTRGQVIGVIGPSRSANSLLAARFGGVFHIPVVSYFSTTDELSNSERFPYFLRTVPSDKFQAGAIADLLLFFDWKYIALFYSIDTYGVHGARHIQYFAEELGICIPINMPVSNLPSESEINDIAVKLRENEKVKVVVIFSLHYPALAVLRAVAEYHIGRKLTFIGSDGWGDEEIFTTDKYASILLGAIFVRLYEVPDFGFHEYYKRLPFNPDHSSQWYKNSLEQIYVSNNCNSTEDCPIPIPYFERQAINAVYVFAHALDAIIRDECLGSSVMCDRMHDGATLLKYMLNVSFPIPGGRFKFDENGDTSGKYVYKNFQRSDGFYDMIDIGTWDSNRDERLDVEETRLEWVISGSGTPRSLCVDDCGPGFIPVPLKTKCCWGCQKCPDYSIVVDGTHCSDCSVTYWPNANISICEPIIPTHLHVHHPVVLCTLLAAFVGLICSGIVAFGLWHHRSHILIKSSSLELGYVNIAGLALACTVAGIIDLYPTPNTCIVSEVLISISVCLIYTPILLKVNRIWRIFQARSARSLRFTSPKGQLVIVGIVVFVQIIFTTCSSLFAASKPHLIIPAQRTPYLEIYCKFGYGFLLSTLYSLVLIVSACYFAFKARRVPSNYNESKFIALNVYSTLIVCISATAVYYTADSVAQQLATLSTSLLFNIYLTFVCLYLPKFYAILTGSEAAAENWRTGGDSVPSAISNQVQPIQNSNE